jgi:hypothetical protein
VNPHIIEKPHIPLDKKLSEATALPIRTATCLSLLRWKMLFAFLCTVLLMMMVWISTSSLFDVPRDVRQDRQLYAVARHQYLENPHYWYSQWLQLELAVKQAIGQNREQDVPELLQQATPQSLIAFLVNRAEVKVEHLTSIATVPKISGSTCIISLSKPEQNIWPFKVMLSAELKITIRQDTISFVVSRLRRGSQELSPHLSWAYFGTEFEHLKRFSTVSTRPNNNLPEK